MNTFVRTQSDLLDAIQDQSDDASNARWTDPRIYAAINRALDMWHGRVKQPHIYTISGGWVAGTFAYTLPDYIDTAGMQPQLWAFVNDPLYYIPVSGSGDTWANVDAYTVEPDTTTGGLVLRLQSSLATTDGRIIWWSHNGHVPTTVAQLSSGISASDTSLTISTVPANIGRNGYIKIGSEWMSYHDYSEGTSTTTLSNLQRGLFNTTAATHSPSDSVYWGVACDTPRLYQQLAYQAKAYLQEYYLNNTSSRETNQYEKAMVYFQDKADEFWKTYKTTRSIRMKLNRMAYGDRTF